MGLLILSEQTDDKKSVVLRVLNKSGATTAQQDKFSEVNVYRFLIREISCECYCGASETSV